MSTSMSPSPSASVNSVGTSIKSELCVFSRESSCSSPSSASSPSPSWCQIQTNQDYFQEQIDDSLWAQQEKLSNSATWWVVAGKFCHLEGNFVIFGRKNIGILQGNLHFASPDSREINIFFSPRLWVLFTQQHPHIHNSAAALDRGRISFRFARIKIDFKVSIITHFNGEIDSHIWMLRESLRESILGFSPNF